VQGSPAAPLPGDPGRAAPEARIAVPRPTGTAVLRYWRTLVLEYRGTGSGRPGR